MVQLLDPRLKTHLTSVGLCEHHIVCIEELQLSLAAQGAMLPGVTALIGNLCTSSASHHIASFLPRGPAHPAHHRYDGSALATAVSLPANGAQHGRGAWFSEYLHGLDQEIYAEVLPPSFTDRPFTVAASLIYESYGVLMIGIVSEQTLEVRPPPTTRPLPLSSTTRQ